MFYITWGCVIVTAVLIVVTLLRSHRPSQGKPYERLMYYDAEKERPAVFRGQRVRVTYSDRQIADIRTV